MNEAVKFSVIVPSYQGAHRILKTIACLEQQTYTNFEVIVVIDGSTDNSEAILRNYDAGVSMHIITQKNKGRAGARNSGARQARADMLIFLDDDVIFGPNLLEQYSRYLEQDASLVVGGLHAVATSDNDEFFKYASYLGKKWTKSNSVNVGVLNVPYFNAANCLIEKKVFFDLGGFDERLTDAEDFDLAIKAFENGLPIYFNNTIQVGHAVQDTFHTYAKRIVQYEVARQNLLLINPAAQKYRPGRIAWSDAKRGLYKAFSSKRWVSMINSGVFLFLPERIRFRLYDFLLTAFLTSSSAIAPTVKTK